MSLYKSIEKAFWHSLTRKIIGNVVFLLLPHIVLIILGGYFASDLKQLILSAQLDNSTELKLMSGLNSLLFASGATILFAFLAGILTIFFMRYLFLKPIREMTRVLKAIREKEGDISATLPTYTYDEISDMARSYNDFTDQLRSMIDETRRHSVSVSLSSTRLQKTVIEAGKASQLQEQQAQMVFQSSSQASQAIDEIASNTQMISHQTGDNMQEIRNSSEELAKVLTQVRSVRELATQFQDTVKKLSENSGNVMNILGMVKEFSDQTNLLALNASIEAARAGDAGRGFAVVADEVRNLSQKVGVATTQIDTNISEMATLVRDTHTSAVTILEYIENTESFIDSTSNQFVKLVSDFEDISHQLTSISAAIEELSHTNRESHDHVHKITELSVEMKEDMDRSKAYSEDLEKATETTQEQLSHFQIGRGGFENMTRTGVEWSKEIMQAMQQLDAQGINLFDQNYKRINPGQEPEKFDVGYASAFERTLQPIFDRFISERPEFIYAIAVDKKGYAPAHHSKVSQPISGDVSIDLVKSRHRRFFKGNRQERRRCSHENSFLLQTYIRDTGEILNDLSIPLYVNGKHWGALIMGFEPRCLLESD